MVPHRFAVFVLAAALAGCTAAPFVDHGMDTRIEKPEDPAFKTGVISVCHTEETARAEVDQLAAEACGRHGWEAKLSRIERYQCRLTVPNRSIYRCIDPKMTTGGGEYINPASKAAVEKWRKEHKRQEGQPSAAPGAAAARARAASGEFSLDMPSWGDMWDASAGAR
ncbi:MAG: hypothetical protein HY985_00195 [Magnetospirillum sp.]|nr:hypothetical protein [Magnetospirillum sp.]